MSILKTQFSRAKRMISSNDLSNRPFKTSASASGRLFNHAWGDTSKSVRVRITSKMDTTRYLSCLHFTLQQKPGKKSKRFIGNRWVFERHPFHDREISTRLWKRGRFTFSKNSGLKFRKFHMPNGTAHSGCTNPTQATARLVIVLVSRIQKSGTAGTTILSNGKGQFGPTDRPKWAADPSKWTTFKGGYKYSGRTEPKWSVPFDF